MSGRLPLAALALAPLLVACGQAPATRLGVDLAVPLSPDDLSAAADLAPAAADLAKRPGDLTVLPDLAGKCLNCQGATPVCDPQSGTCVACTPQKDVCPVGEYCEAAKGGFQCVAGCKADGDCPADGGVGKVACCAHQCVDLVGDAKNCGKCGTACAQACCAGACVDVSKDPLHCGGCGKPCPNGQMNHALIACVQSQCAINACIGGYTDCDKDASNGCEANLQGDPLNCGQCGNFCNVANGMGACSNGCKIQSCYAGFADCNKNAVDGCEVTVTKDPQNCGSCGKVCPAPPNALASCFGGGCAVGGCSPGFGDCDGNVQNGCERALANDPANCGKCGNDCGQALNGIAGCMDSLCKLVSCKVPFSDCNMNPVDGCEVNIQTDPAHCAGCGKGCLKPAHGVAGCANGTCGFGGCNAGFGNCNGNANDGCEVNLMADAAHCGKCGMPCPQNQVCAGGLCIAQPECVNAMPLDDKTRNVAFSGSVVCDSALNNLWYRFIGASGTKMPTTAPQTMLCGTHAPGWLSGTYPNVGDGVVQRMVCFNWSGNACNWNAMIAIINCGNYYVFRLPTPPACNLRYCGTD
ncbi:MAG: hypothetical protein EXR72_11975 [Myxococcales bacterium]|nr:hypothetical protein [Myxococcales bacterium]